MWAALKAARSLEQATNVVAIELLAASQAIDLLAPLETSVPLAAVHAAIRAEVSAIESDRPPAPDIARLAKLISSGAIERACDLIRLIELSRETRTLALELHSVRPLEISHTPTEDGLALHEFF